MGCDGWGFLVEYLLHKKAVQKNCSMFWMQHIGQYKWIACDTSAISSRYLLAFCVLSLCVTVFHHTVIRGMKKRRKLIGNFTNQRENTFCSWLLPSVISHTNFEEDVKCNLFSFSDWESQNQNKHDYSYFYVAMINGHFDLHFLCSCFLRKKKMQSSCK